MFFAGKIGFIVTASSNRAVMIKIFKALWKVKCYKKAEIVKYIVFEILLL